MNKDVFETFYLKRPLKSSHSNDSIRGVDDSAQSFARLNNISLSNDNGCPSLSKKASSEHLEKLEIIKPREYLFGSTIDRKAKDQPEKKNVYKHNDNNTTSNNENIYSDRFKTITINNLRRSFRDTFLDSAKPAKGREHQQLWFIDVKDKQEKPKDNIKKSIKNSNWQPINDDTSYGNDGRRVKRNGTFRVDNGIGEGSKYIALDRNKTFRVNRDQSPDQPMKRCSSIDSDSSFTKNYNSPSKMSLKGKFVPIAVTAPYSASIDTGNYCNFPFNPEYNRELNKREDEQHDTDHEEKPYLSEKLSNIRRYSPTQYRKPNNTNIPTGATTKAFIEIESPIRSSYIYNRAANNQNPFENRSIPERLSFNNFQPTFDESRRNRSYTSLRTKLEQTDRLKRINLRSNKYDIIDTEGSSVKNLNSSSQLKTAEPWRSISSRQFSKNMDTENRSFVPYCDLNKSDNIAMKPKLKQKPQINNRTMININCTNSSLEQNIDQANNVPIHTHSFSIPLMANNLTFTRKSKTNKNRSVNFPSVECEVRIISPNYDTKPSRTLRSAKDWTFNQVHM